MKCGAEAIVTFNLRHLPDTVLDNWNIEAQHPFEFLVRLYHLNIVRHNGRRGVLVTIIKSGSASTLSLVDGIRQLLPRVELTLPPQLRIQPLADQSVFVRAAIEGVVREATIAAGLTALMILLFLGMRALSLT